MSDSDHFEVEKKYALSEQDRAKVESRLEDLGFVFVSTRNLQDHFIPGTRKGELLRVRQEGNHHFVLTFKASTKIAGKKTKRESEPQIHAIAAHLIIEAATRELGESLPTLYKVRRDFKKVWSGFVAHVVLDYVPELEELFSSYFLEVEIIVNDAGKVQAAKKAVLEIARALFEEDRKPMKKSYRRMLFKSLKARKAFPKRWYKITGKKKSHLDPRDTGSVGVSPRQSKKESRKKAK